MGFFDVPMGVIEEAKEERSTTTTGAPELKLRVQTKDFRSCSFLMTRDDDMRGILDALGAFGWPGNPTLLFAFKHAEATWAEAPRSADDGWKLYDPSTEYVRMGVETKTLPNSASPWVVSDMNDKYGLCPTYPAALVLPRSMSDPDVQAVASFRKKGRLPALSWCGGPDMEYASLWRCSQTTEGIMGQKCPEDQKMVECIRRGAGRDRDLLVVDL